MSTPPPERHDGSTPAFTGGAPRAPHPVPRRQGCLANVITFIGFGFIGFAVLVALISFGPLIALAGIGAIAVAIWKVLA